MQECWHDTSNDLTVKHLFPYFRNTILFFERLHLTHLEELAPRRFDDPAKLPVPTALDESTLPACESKIGIYLTYAIDPFTAILIRARFDELNRLVC